MKLALTLKDNGRDRNDIKVQESGSVKLDLILDFWSLVTDPWLLAP